MAINFNNKPSFMRLQGGGSIDSGSFKVTLSGTTLKRKVSATDATPVNSDLELAEAQNVLDWLDLLYHQNHRDVMNSVAWQKLYSVANRALTYAGGPGGPEASVPCYYCGLILPLDLIQIDHQKAQEGQADGYGFHMYVYKGIHTVGDGLTVRGPKGHKNSQITNIKRHLAHPTPANLGQINVVPTKGHVRANGWAERNAPTLAQSKLDRYSVTEKGLTFLIFAAGIVFHELDSRCKNSMLNLVPSCSKCNGSKSNKNFPVRL